MSPECITAARLFTAMASLLLSELLVGATDTGLKRSDMLAALLLFAGGTARVNPVASL